MNKTKRKFTAEFKEQALGLMSMGKPVADVARDLEVSLSTHPIYFSFLIHDEQVTFGVADEVGEFGFKVSCTLESAKKLMEKNRVFRGVMPLCTCRKGPLRNSKRRSN